MADHFHKIAGQRFPELSEVAVGRTSNTDARTKVCAVASSNPFSGALLRIAEAAVSVLSLNGGGVSFTPSPHDVIMPL